MRAKREVTSFLVWLHDEDSCPSIVVVKEHTWELRLMQIHKPDSGQVAVGLGFVGHRFSINLEWRQRAPKT